MSNETHDVRPVPYLALAVYADWPYVDRAYALLRSAYQGVDRRGYCDE